MDPLRTIALIDLKPLEPTDEEYQQQKAAAAQCFTSRDYEGAKAIYTALLLNPETRNAVVYSNRSLVNMKLDLPFSAFDDAQHACELSRGTWKKAYARYAEAASALNMYDIVEKCFGRMGDHKRAQEARACRAAQIQQARDFTKQMRSDPRARQMCRSAAEFEEVTGEHRLTSYGSYRPRPQVSHRDPIRIAQVIDEINASHRKIAVQDIPGMGRGIVARRLIRKGEVVLVEDPFVGAIVHGDRCQQCFRELNATPKFPHPPTAVTCDGCGVERYCSEECRGKAWELYHRVQCAHADKLQRLADMCAQGFSTTSMVWATVARLAGITMCNPSWPCHTLSLGPMQLLSPPVTSSFDCDAGQLLDWYNFLDEALGLREDPRFDMEWFDTVTRVVINNSFTVEREGYSFNGPQRSRLGTGLYALASLFNHSCVPNAMWSAGQCGDNAHAFNAITVKATKKIKPGEQIFIPYFDTDTQYHIRAAQMFRFGFTCCCEKCERERPHALNASPAKDEK